MLSPGVLGVAGPVPALLQEIDPMVTFPVVHAPDGTAGRRARACGSDPGTLGSMGIDHGALVETVQALVRIPSVFDPTTDRCEQPAADHVAGLMRHFGWEPVVDVVAPGRPNVHCIVDGGRPGPTLAFEGHTDVVTEGDVNLWTVDPFAARIIDGRLYGRGSADMKAGLAAALYAARALADRGPFPGRVMIAALCDEEGMMAGAKDFVARGRLAGVVGIICCEPEAGEICTVAKGALRLRVDFHGRMAHGAMPFAGANPNRALGRFLTAVEEMERSLHERLGDHEHLGRVWLTPTVVHAGAPVQMNVMPADASVWLDVRTIPGIEHGVLLAELRDAARQAGAGIGISTEVELIDDRPVVEVSPDDPLVRAVWDAHAGVLGETPRLGGVPGATDGTVLTSRTGIPSLVYGPGGKFIAHQADEFVEIADIARHAEVYVDAAQRFFAAAQG